jgi:hypothetical protein
LREAYEYIGFILSNPALLEQIEEFKISRENLPADDAILSDQFSLAVILKENSHLSLLEIIQMSKSVILRALKDGRKQFLNTIEGLSDEDMQMPSVMDIWSVKDILVHLTMWEAELVKLLWQARQGLIPTTAHFSQETLDQINARWYEANLYRSLDQVMEDFLGVRKQTIRRLETFTNEEFVDPKFFPWLNGLSLGEKIARSSYKHEAEHASQIRSWRQEQGI